MTSLIDTNVLVYRHDPRVPEKRRIAIALLEAGIADDSIRLPHQAVIEFMAAVTKRQRGGSPLLSREEAAAQIDELLMTFAMLYPTADVVRNAVRGAAAYGLSWYDAHLWAYAETFGIDELVSEDFQDGRRYGSVIVRNPFAPPTGGRASERRSRLGRRARR